jgi:hypothetical protein
MFIVSLFGVEQSCHDLCPILQQATTWRQKRFYDIVASSKPYRQQTPLKQPLKLNRRDLNLTKFSKSSPESQKTEIVSPPTTPVQKQQQEPSRFQR